MPNREIRLEYTRHATDAMNERRIPVEWVERVVGAPALRTPDPMDLELERLYATIPEYDDRVLRVVVNTSVANWRVVSVFFDRNMKGEL